MSSSTSPGSELEGEAEKEYEVLRILDYEEDEQGVKWYKVKWCDDETTNWSEDQYDQWQREDSLNCPDKLREWKEQQRANKKRKNESLGGGESSKKARHSTSKDRSISRDREAPQGSGSNAQKKTAKKKRAFIESDDEEAEDRSTSRSNSKSRTTGGKKDERSRSTSSTRKDALATSSSSSTAPRQHDPPTSSSASDLVVTKHIEARPEIKEKLILKIPKVEVKPRETPEEKQVLEKTGEKKSNEAVVAEKTKEIDERAPTFTQPLPPPASSAVVPPIAKEAATVEEPENIVEQPEESETIEDVAPEEEDVVQPVAPVIRAQPSITAPAQYIDVEDYEDDSDEELDSDDEEEDSEDEEEEEEEDDEHDGEGNKVYDENGKFMYTIKTMAEGEKNGYELGHEGIIIEHDTFTDPTGKTVRLFRVIFEDLETSQFIEEDEVKRHDSDAYGVYMARQIEIEEEKEKLRDIRLRLHLLNSE